MHNYFYVLVCHIFFATLKEPCADKPANTWLFPEIGGTTIFHFTQCIPGAHNNLFLIH